MEKYFWICKERLVKGICLEGEFLLANEAYEYTEGA